MLCSALANMLLPLAPAHAHASCAALADLAAAATPEPALRFAELWGCAGAGAREPLGALLRRCGRGAPRFVAAGVPALTGSALVVARGPLGEPPRPPPGCPLPLPLAAFPPPATHPRCLLVRHLQQCSPGHGCVATICAL